MKNETVQAVAEVIIGAVHSDALVPANLLRDLGSALAPEAGNVGPIITEVWQRHAKAREQDGKPPLNTRLPLMLSRGYLNVMAEDELRQYLPEEKILINKDSFRSRLDGVEFANLDAGNERRLIDDLSADAIGLSRDDVVLYYNLIKLNALARNKAQAIEQPAAPPTVVTAESIVELAVAAFELTPDVLARANSGKPIERSPLVNVVKALIGARKMQPLVAANVFGLHTDRFVTLFGDFVRFVTVQRGEDSTELLVHAGLYCLLNGADATTLQALGLSVPMVSWLTDKIGRMRTLYYTTVVFMRTFVLVLFAQVFEISSKYHASDAGQAQKLARLYGTEDRLAMLVTNATTLATRSIAQYKTESREVVALFKRFPPAQKRLVRPADLFETRYQ